MKHENETAQPAPLGQVDRGVGPLAWTAERKPDGKCHYTHCIAETPFGRFLLTWKGWKDDIDPVADETPWGEFFTPCAGTVAEAQAACEREYARRVARGWPALLNLPS